MRKSYKQDSVAGFVFSESFQQLLKCAWVVRPKVVLVNVDEVIRNIGLDCVDIFAPLGESAHFWCHIRVFSTFCFGDDYTLPSASLTIKSG